MKVRASVRQSLAGLTVIKDALEPGKKKRTCLPARYTLSAPSTHSLCFALRPFMASPNSQLTNCDRNLYPLSHESGQRRLGPPIDWFGSPPAKGCEVFVGHLPRDMLEDRLLEFFALVGRVYQIRLMMETR